MDSGDTTFVLLSAALVLLMTPALALFYGGFVGEKMAISTMLMSFAALSIITIEWSLLTYSLAFGTHPDPAVDRLIGGTVFGAFDSPDNLRAGTAIPEHANMVFQLAFAAVTSAVISGGVCGRITYPAWCIFIAIWHVLVYVPLAHWIFYSGGWLAQNGVLDFAVRGDPFTALPCISLATCLHFTLTPVNPAPLCIISLLPLFPLFPFLLPSSFPQTGRPSRRDQQRRVRLCAGWLGVLRHAPSAAAAAAAPHCYRPCLYLLHPPTQ